MKPSLLIISYLLLITSLSGCISITNHVTVSAPADPANPAIAEMERAAPTNALASRANGTVGIACAIYSHKTISPDTTATLAK